MQSSIERFQKSLKQSLAEITQAEQRKRKDQQERRDREIARALLQ